VKKGPAADYWFTTADPLQQHPYSGSLRRRVAAGVLQRVLPDFAAELLSPPAPAVHVSFDILM